MRNTCDSLNWGEHKRVWCWDLYFLVCHVCMLIRINRKMYWSCSVGKNNFTKDYLVFFFFTCNTVCHSFKYSIIMAKCCLDKSFTVSYIFGPQFSLSKFSLGSMGSNCIPFNGRLKSVFLRGVKNSGRSIIWMCGHLGNHDVTSLSFNSTVLSGTLCCFSGNIVSIP